MSTLHNKLTYDAEDLKRLMIAGYARSITDNEDFPLELITLFYNYYNDALYWHLDTKRFKDAKAITLEDIEANSCIPNAISKLFTFKSIQIEYRFHINYQYKPDLLATLIHFKVKIPKNVREVEFFVEMYCPEINATIRRCKTSRYGQQDSTYSAPFAMKNLATYEQILIATRFEILSIKYSSEITPYYKPIFMKKYIEYE